MTPSTRSPHRPFTLVLAGGGARGASHLGVLRGLEHAGWTPSAIVGVFMGAIVGATYALNPDWYRAYLAADLSRVPGLIRDPGQGTAARLRRLADGGRYVRHLLARWGPLPPAARNGALLADGAYADIAPIDVAQALADGPTIVVKPSNGSGEPTLRNGPQVLQRSMEIAYQRQAAVRFAAADLELTVTFPYPIASTNFEQIRTCVAAGLRAVHARRAELRALLAPLPASSRSAPRPTTPTRSSTT